ncbi:MAG TPA: hypothetical protein VGT24_03985 [Candidatus Acidoferrales bacterium]|nr:hypothetical protein [Candidatus Acidoferrales bacterium]
MIDICCLGMVFDGRNKKHPQFTPVLEWINAGGYMIYGGTKYNEELRRIPKYLPYIAELSKKRRTIRIESDVVDRIATNLKEKIADPDFDDEHLVALVIASRCCVVCTDDNGAISFLRRSDLFKGYIGANRPKIYRGRKSHGRLCCSEHVVGICREQG